VTRLLVDPATDFDDPTPVTITATLLDPAPALVRTFTDVTAATVVDLPAPSAAEAWRLTIRRPVTTINRWNLATTNPGPIVEERTVHFPDGAPVAWAALTDVDPATLEAPTAPGTAWQAALAELTARVDALPTGSGGGGVAIDTDGVPYYSPAGTHSVLLDVDGVPYLAA
jgi:hypothetical protein